MGIVGNVGQGPLSRPLTPHVYWPYQEINPHPRLCRVAQGSSPRKCVLDITFVLIDGAGNPGSRQPFELHLIDR